MPTAYEITVCNYICKPQFLHPQSKENVSMVHATLSYSCSKFYDSIKVGVFPSVSSSFTEELMLTPCKMSKSKAFTLKEGKGEGSNRVSQAPRTTCAVSEALAPHCQVFLCFQGYPLDDRPGLSPSSPSLISPRRRGMT